MANINIDNKVKKVSNDKTKQQNEELEALKKQKAEADKKAKQKQAEETKQTKQEKAYNKEDLAALASSVGSIIGSNKKKSSFKSSLVSLVIGVVLGFLLATFLGFGGEKDPIYNETIDETVLTHTEVDFKDVILGEVQEHQELIVMEQPLEVATTITKSGLANLSIFSKVKDVKYAGKGMYTVDMSKIDNEHIDVDLGNKIVKIIIPHTVLQEVILDVDNIQFEDTEKGLLAFGDLALTAEEQNKIETSVRATMSETLNAKEFFDQADEFAKLKTWQIFQPLVSSVSPEFIVEMVFE